MTIILTEKTPTGELKFEFSDKWQACKYDEQPFYNKLRGQSLKAVDFMALSTNGLLLMEVKYVTATDKNSHVGRNKPVRAQARTGVSGNTAHSAGNACTALGQSYSGLLGCYRVSSITYY